MELAHRRQLPRVGPLAVGARHLQDGGESLEGRVPEQARKGAGPIVLWPTVLMCLPAGPVLRLVTGRAR